MPADRFPDVLCIAPRNSGAVISLLASAERSAAAVGCITELGALSTLGSLRFYHCMPSGLLPFPLTLHCFTAMTQQTLRSTVLFVISFPVLTLRLFSCSNREVAVGSTCVVFAPAAAVATSRLCSALRGRERFERRRLSGRSFARCASVCHSTRYALCCVLCPLLYIHFI